MTDYISEISRLIVSVDIWFNCIAFIIMFTDSAWIKDDRNLIPMFSELLQYSEYLSYQFSEYQS